MQFSTSTPKCPLTSGVRRLVSTRLLCAGDRASAGAPTWHARVRAPRGGYELLTSLFADKPLLQSGSRIADSRVECGMDFLERLLHVSPDGGSGALELLLVLVP